MTQAPCSSILLLPLHLLVLAIFLAYLIIGAYVFSALEDPSGGGGAVEVSRSAVTLPGTPRHPYMTAARQELVERLINTSSSLILERSQEVVIAAITVSPRMQRLIQALQREEAILPSLPSDRQLDRLSRSLMTEWRQDLHHLTARYHTLVARHSLGIQVDKKERDAVWGEEEPPPPLPWRTTHALLHAYCLVSTLGGGGVRAQTSAGRAACVVYTVVGVVLYVACVGMWAARLRATVAILIKMCSRKKVQAREGKASPYHNMHTTRPSPPPQPTTTTTTTNPTAPPLHHHHDPFPHHHHPYHLPGSTHTRDALFLLFVIFVYVLSLGAVATPGDSFWAGVENAMNALLCVQPPLPLPQELGRISGFIAYTFVGHLLMALFLYSAKEWWWVWWRGRSRLS